MHDFTTARALIAAALLTGSAVSAQQQPAAGSVQQDYDAATALDAGKDNAAALAAWEKLEPRTKPGSRSRAIVQVRRGGALFRLGRRDEALAMIRTGLAGLPTDDASLAEDRSKAHAMLGRIAADAFDYAGAAAEYAQAEKNAVVPADMLIALLGLSQAQIFTDPAAAGATLDRADAVLKTASVDNASRALFMRRRAMLHMNQGDFEVARRDGKAAVQLLGGITNRTDLLDVSARSDTAIAALLGGHEEEAREYLAYTGAGRSTKGEFSPGAQMKAPDCGGEADLRPEDVGVVEFSIGDDGTVIQATPIYASGGGEKALAFARIVQDWWWNPEQIKTLPAFYRYNMRVEMRCSTAFSRPSIGGELDSEAVAWLEGKGVTVAPDPERPGPATLAAQREALRQADAGKGAESLAALGAIQALLTNAMVPDAEKKPLATRALAIATAAGAPAPVRLNYAMTMLTADAPDLWKPGRFRRAVEPMLTDPVYAGDPQARAALRLMIADRDRKRGAESEPLLRQVADDGALAANDPLKVGALVRLASLAQARGDGTAARAAFDRTGLSANQCSIMDAPPKQLSSFGANDFPTDALRWGFEGWTQLQYDVKADGSVANARTLLSYPPFVFSKAGTKMFSAARYAKTYRPDGSLGCGATTQRVNFRLPG